MNVDPEHGETHLDELLSRFASGDDSALGALVDREAPRVLRRLQARIPARLQRRIGASDIMQLTAAELVGMRRRFENKGPAAFRNLVDTIADHILVNSIHREGAQKRDIRRERSPAPASDSQPDHLQRIAADGSSPSQKLMRHEHAMMVRQCFARLGVRDQEIVQLIDYDGVAYEDVARALGITPETARQRHHRAIERLREQLRESGLRSED